MPPPRQHGRDGGWSSKYRGRSPLKGGAHSVNDQIQSYFPLKKSDVISITYRYYLLPSTSTTNMYFRPARTPEINEGGTEIPQSAQPQKRHLHAQKPLFPRSSNTQVNYNTLSLPATQQCTIACSQNAYIYIRYLACRRRSLL